MAQKGHKQTYFGTHKLSDSRIYSIYYAMKDRCYNPKVKNYRNYGGRGITVCEDWLDKENGFINFYNWAIQNGYKEELLPNGINKWTLDRIDNDGNYQPNNCRWVVHKENERNKRTNKIIDFNGEKHSVVEWAEILNMPVTTLYNRLFEGWDIERAFTTPVITKHRNKKYLTS